MLTQIKLTNFKCFKEETTFPLSKFNLFTGVNGGGKSTLLQSLLLIKQSIEHDIYTSELLLNGSCINLGSFDDVRNREISKTEPISFEFSVSHHDVVDEIAELVRYQLKPKNDEMSLYISKISIINSKEELCEINNEDGLFRLIKLEPADSFIDKFMTKKIMFSFGENDEERSSYLKIEKIHFISADRIGPQEIYSKSTLSKFPNVGARGEFTVNLLDKLAEQLVNEALCLGDDATTLRTQTQEWLGKILNPMKLEVPRSKTNVLELFFNDAKPANVGFGYSSILPIIVSGLIAKPNEKIIVENPEIHLHPKAQSALIEFLVKVANTGVQVFIESHSDHVLNALRIVTKNKILKPDDVNILFFAQEKGISKIIKPMLDENGRIDQWPEYFFDETAKSLASLASGHRPRTKAPK
jgi:predicted ATPase